MFAVHVDDIVETTVRGGRMMHSLEMSTILSYRPYMYIASISYCALQPHPHSNSCTSAPPSFKLLHFSPTLLQTHALQPHPLFSSCTSAPPSFKLITSHLLHAMRPKSFTSLLVHIHRSKPASTCRVSIHAYPLPFYR